MSTDFSIKCEILSEVFQESSWNSDLSDFRKYNDMGLPLAHAVHNGLVTLHEVGEQYIDETWEKLCLMLGVEEDNEYKSSDDILSKSPIVKNIKDR